ncbi:unnamed protein product, partial [Scytosiphon promiscuus]
STGAATGAGTGASADPDNGNAGPSGYDPLSSAASSSYPAELAELVKLYCGRCQDLSSRLRAAVADREALSASTMSFLRSGRGLAAAAGASGGAQGLALTARSRAASGAAMAARLAASASPGFGTSGLRADRGSNG